jgi:hypothetical protein
MADPNEERTQGEFEVGFACIFCDEEAAEAALDTCYVTVAASGGTLSVWCHADCFRAAAHEPEHFPDLVGSASASNAASEDEELDEAQDVVGDILTEIAVAELTDAQAAWALAHDRVETARRHGITIETEPINDQPDEHET